ncbi:methyl-accepting chemotaxis protein [Alicyclobacillus sp.]|uniref:methyl-accepting chemotaxis protein n=1 Tax=Alicyclobacillus sp. TaxID=61169 RepID=UPI0025BD9EAD|nr:methyl-accepting chemotaxis protein [Alicyclobacillus sp.]MCL6517165.1 hypothetical protein [Alicyclobacillus sp.]
MATGDIGDTDAVVSGHSDLVELVRALEHAKGNIRMILENLKLASVHLTESSEALREGARQTTSAAEHTASSVTDMHQHTWFQQQMVWETEKRMRETLKTVERIQKLGDVALRLSQADQEKVDAAKSEIQRTDERMRAIRNQTEHLTAQAESLSAHAKQVIQTTELIREIADQTHLLALNAAIEAAHAGEEARGFTVVADEVRRLAAQTKQASARVDNVVREMGRQSAASLSAALSVAAAVEDGQQAVEAASRTFLSLVEDLSQQDACLQQIEEAATDIGLRTQAVQQHMSQVLDTSQQHTALVDSVSAASGAQVAMMQQVAATAEDVRNTAKRLQELAEKF